MIFSTFGKPIPLSLVIALFIWVVMICCSVSCSCDCLNVPFVIIVYTFPFSNTGTVTANVLVNTVSGVPSATFQPINKRLMSPVVTGAVSVSIVG